MPEAATAPDTVSAIEIAGYTCLAEGIYLEGLSVDHARGVIWYSDVIAGGIHGVRPDGTKVCSFNETRMWTGGVLMNADGAVLSSGEGGIMWNHPDTGQSGWLLQEIDGQPINGINEMVPDGTGGIFFGTNDIEMVIAAGTPRPTALYRLTVDGEVIRLADGLAFTNGIMFDAARRLFHCSDTFGAAWTWDVTPDLQLANKRLLLDRDDCDGMALQTDGTIWVTGFRSPGIIRRLTPIGVELEPVRTPPGASCQIRFGGDGHDFYLAHVPENAGECLKEGLPLSGVSGIWKGRSPWPGQLLGTANFRLG